MSWRRDKLYREIAYYKIIMLVQECELTRELETNFML